MLSETVPLPEGGSTRTVEYTYFNNGTRKTVTAAGSTTTYTYDGQNRLKTATVGTEPATTYTYFPDGLTDTVTYPNGVVATHTYDKADRLINLTNAVGATLISAYAYAYDANGNRLTQTETLGGPAEQTADAHRDKLKNSYGSDPARPIEILVVERVVR